jgi:hypothetical protein
MFIMNDSRFDVDRCHIDLLKTNKNLPSCYLNVTSLSMAYLKALMTKFYSNSFFFYSRLSVDYDIYFIYMLIAVKFNLSLPLYFSIL